jgi:hypothetical protein
MPIVLIDSPGANFWSGWQHYVKNHLLKQGLISNQDLHLYRITHDVDVAVEEVRRFYSNYHSMRYTRDEIIIRLHRAPGDRQLREISETFSDINMGGEFRVSRALPVERDEPALNDLPRLVFAFNRRDHGRLRQLIDFLNAL